MKKLWFGFIVSFVILISSTQLSAYSTPVQLGGEIPWPFSEQFEVGKEHSEGLWMITHYDGHKSYLNLEIIENTESKVSWLRASELDAETLEVISWGEGYYTESTRSQNFVFFEDDVVVQDEIGRYVYMIKNKNSGEYAYLLRLVEVSSGVGHALGVSFYNSSKSENVDHVLGLRMLKKPLRCSIGRDNHPGVEGGLICDFDESKFSK